MQEHLLWHNEQHLHSAQVHDSHLFKHDFRSCIVFKADLSIVGKQSLVKMATRMHDFLAPWLLLQNVFISSWQFTKDVGVAINMAEHSLPSRPALPTSCQYLTKFVGAPQCIMRSTSRTSMPIPNPIVDIKHRRVPFICSMFASIRSLSIFVWSELYWSKILFSAVWGLLTKATVRNWHWIHVKILPMTSFCLQHRIMFRINNDKWQLAKTGVHLVTHS